MITLLLTARNLTNNGKGRHSETSKATTVQDLTKETNIISLLRETFQSGTLTVGLVLQVNLEEVTLFLGHEAHDAIGNINTFIFAVPLSIGIRNFSNPLNSSRIGTTFIGVQFQVVKGTRVERAPSFRIPGRLHPAWAYAFGCANDGLP